VSCKRTPSCLRGKPAASRSCSARAGILGVRRDIRFGGPVSGQHARGQLRLPMKEIADERFAVGRESESLANFAMGQDRIFEIKTEVGEIRAGAIGHCKIGLARENGNDVRRKRTSSQDRQSLCEVRAREPTPSGTTRNRTRGSEARHESTQDFVRRPPLPSCDCCTKRKGRSRWVAGKIGAGVRWNDPNGARNEI